MSLLTNYPNGLSSFGIPLTGPWGNVPLDGEVFFVDGENGNDGNPGTSPDSSFSTIGRALEFVTSGKGTMIFIAPGSYAENIEITQDYVCLIGMLSGGYARPDVVPDSGVALTVIAQGFVCHHIRFAAPAEDTDLVLHEGNGYLYSDCVFDGDATMGNEKALVRLKGNADDDSYTASEGTIRGCLLRNSGGIGVIFDTGDAPGNGVGVTGAIIEGCQFTLNDQQDIATADTGGGVYSVQDALIRNNNFATKNKTCYIDLTTSNGGAAGDQTGAIQGNVFAADAINTTRIAMVGTGFTFGGNFSNLGVVDGTGLD